MTPKPNGRTHPLADLWPLLPSDDLDTLAEDIAANGLIHPLVLDGEGTLIDGRNRREACQRAGITPTYVSINGQDPVAYIASANANRRQSNKGQLALWAAAANDCPPGGQSVRQIARLVGVGKSAIAQAKTILAYEDLTASVRSGSLSLKAAYEQAQQRKEAADSEDAKLATLRDEAPDLADQVESEQLSLAEAMGALRARRDEARIRAADEQQRRTVTTRLLTDTIYWIATMLPTPEWRATVHRDYDPGSAGPRAAVTAAALRQAADHLAALAEEWARED